LAASICSASARRAALLANPKAHKPAEGRVVQNVDHRRHPGDGEVALPQRKFLKAPLAARRPDREFDADQDFVRLKYRRQQAQKEMSGFD
jgi:hypothetical protein